MKAILILLFCCLAFADNGSLPSKFSISAYAVNDYSASLGKNSNLPRSIYHKNKFISAMIKKINGKYPKISTSVLYNRENSAATRAAFLTDKTNLTEFVFFAGHGNQQKLFFYDQSLELDNTKMFGEFTRWVIFDACLVLNVNKRNYISESFSSSTIDVNRFVRIYQLFNGVHSILGNYGLGWQGNIKKHWYSSARWRTEDVYEYFSKYFIEDGDAIWDAYVSAVKKVYNNFHNNAALGYYTNISGYDSAIWYFYGVYSNGEILDMSNEKFSKTYNSPVFLNDSRFKSKGLRLKRMKIGNPKYE